LRFAFFLAKLVPTTVGAEKADAIAAERIEEVKNVE